MIVIQRLLKELRTQIVVVTLVSGIAFAALYTPELVGLYKHLSGDTALQCDFRQAWAAGQNGYLQSTNTTRVSQASRVHQTDGDLALVRTPSADWWVPGDSIEALYYDLAEQARDIYGQVQAGEVVIDCGANIGVYSKKSIEQGAKLVIAIEPVPDNLRCLRRNLGKEIADGRVVVIDKGVWDKEDELPMYHHAGNQAAHSFVRGAAGQSLTDWKLPLTTVDRIVSELKLSRVDVIKMDIEGSERRALTGAERTVRHFKPRLALSVYHLSDDPEVIPKTVFGFEPAYRMSCDCLNFSDGILPEIAHFRAR